MPQILNGRDQRSVAATDLYPSAPCRMRCCPPETIRRIRIRGRPAQSLLLVNGAAISNLKSQCISHGATHALSRPEISRMLETPSISPDSLNDS